jgi:hypothetical protein
MQAKRNAPDLMTQMKEKRRYPDDLRRNLSMRLAIEIAIAALLVFCISASSAAFAAEKTDRGADDVTCAFTVPQNAAPRSAANAAGSFTPIIAATSCCRRCDFDAGCVLARPGASC